LFVTPSTAHSDQQRSPFAGGAARLPKSTAHTLDPFHRLTAAAAVTNGSSWALGICLSVEHHPIVLAKRREFSILLSKRGSSSGSGRAGTLKRIGTPRTVFKTRFRSPPRRILAMREIWTKEAAEFSHGRVP